MGEKRWNDNFTITYRERRTRDPLYKCNYDILYTQSVLCGSLADIESKPVKADRYGYYHGTSM